MYHHGHILKRTIYDKNTYIDHPDEGYTECITYDKDFHEREHVIIDFDKKEEVSKYKIYVRINGNKRYAVLTYKGRKIFLHRFLLGIYHNDYKLENTVDHINGDSLDNRIANLRICSQTDNSKNNRGKHAVVGVGWLKVNKKWTARIMSNYKGIHLGNFNTYEEAVLARLKKEKEICGEYGPNRDLYYIVGHPSPIEEIKKVVSEMERNRIGRKYGGEVL